ncbi:fungal-specific transcription factor domain-containing protein [Xylariales sp. PMI_506]|nr:fungal-specific transcription factor domain-containing protein [Xylariales sp. PMI_506]
METGSVQKRRGTVSTACLRCHRRKQRCVGFPTCSNCSAAKVTCSRHPSTSTRRLAGLSKEELLKRIESLEENASAQATVAEHSPEDDARPNTLSPSPSRCDGHSGSPARVAGDDLHPRYTHDEGAESRRVVLTAYLESMHRRVPLCDYTDILRTNAAEAQTAPSTDVARMKLFRLYMACAIGAMVRQATGISLTLSPSEYLDKALELKDSFETPGLVEEAEITLWIVLYKLRTSFSHEVWCLIGSALRAAIGADLHREHHYTALTPMEAELQRRLFWSVYIIERNVCWALKRPFSLADHDIDTELPTPLLQSTHLDQEDETHPVDGPNRPLDIRMFISCIRLARINTKVYVQTYRLDQTCTAPEQILLLLDEMRQFELTLPNCSAPDSEFLQLHVKNAVRVLLEPFLSTLDPSDSLISVCLEASGAICKLFKRLRLHRGLGFSFTMIKSVFLAGMTICYIVSKNPSFWTPTRANDLRACSSSLFAIAEKNSAVRKYCDTLDTIIEGVSEYVEQVSGSLGMLPHNMHSPESPFDLAHESGSPQTAFDNLRRKFQDMKRHFASPSYPSYPLEPGDLRNVLPFSTWKAVDGFDMSPQQLSSIPVPTDAIGLLEGAHEIESMDFLIVGDQFL